MADNEPASSLVIVTLIMLALISYFLPTVVAGIRGHADKGPIFIINLFLGWSLVGWCTRRSKNRPHRAAVAA